jgi:hypothetical protein
MAEELIVSSCDRHGVDRHVFVHESGHAIAGIEHGVTFRAVVLYDDASAPRFLGGLGYAPGAVDMGTDDASTWVQPDVVGSLRFVCAGFAAEQAVLGHPIDGGFREDLRAWRIGGDRKDEQTEEALAELLGQPFMEIVEQVQDWAVSQSVRITALADHLGEQSTPYEMPRDEVEAFLRGL